MTTVDRALWRLMGWLIEAESALQRAQRWLLYILDDRRRA